MPAEIFGPDYAFLPENKLLSFAEIIRLTNIFTSLGVEKIRITGGEPLLRKNLPTLIRMLRQVEGVRDMAMTTNGSLLTQHAHALKEAGLDRVTVSLGSTIRTLSPWLLFVGRTAMCFAGEYRRFGISVTIIIPKND